MSNQDDSSKDNFPPYRETQYGQGRGHGRGMGRGRGRGRGRPPVAYPIEVSRTTSRKLGIISLTSFELKLLLLTDIEELTQQQIADRLNISQTSVWRYLKSIRTRIAEAIAQHNQIEILVVDKQ